MAPFIAGILNCFVVNTGREVAVRGCIESAVLVHYSRAIDSWFNLHTGVRHDFKPGPARIYATIGIDEIAPFRVQGRRCAVPSRHARPNGVNIVDHKGVGRDFAIIMIVTQMRMAGREIIVAMCNHFGVV